MCVLRWLSITIFGILIAVPASAAEIPFESQGAILQWIDGYRLHPTPRRLPEAVKALSRLGQFSGQDKAAFFIGFMAGVIAKNPKSAERLVNKMLPLPEGEEAVVVKAIAFSGLPDWKVLLTKIEPKISARKVIITKYLHDDLLPLPVLPLDAEPNLLDTLWGNYYATGSPEPVMQIISALHWTEQDDDVERLTIGNAVKWTLAANAARNGALLKLYYSQVGQLQLADATPLQDIIDAVEDFDPERVRRDGQKVMEAAMRKPSTKPDAGGGLTRWATKAGSTAISLGCVVAGVTGHAEIAAPCVVAGALYSAGSSLYFDSPWDTTVR